MDDEIEKGRDRTCMSMIPIYQFLSRKKKLGIQTMAIGIKMLMRDPGIL